MSSVNADHAWEAVLNRDRRRDGKFVYAVSSTRVYCRPSCPSRRPTRNHVTFFDSPQLAESAGYRACLRCRPQSVVGSKAEELVERARRYLDDHADETITLRRLAAHVGLSPFHLQRTFVKKVGLSPKRYQDAERMARFTASLKRGETVTHATYDAGFGSSSRLYARVHTDLGMTPSAFRSGGRGVTFRYITVPTAVGRMLVAATERGIAVVSLGDTEAALVTSLRSDYPKAALRRDRNGLLKYVCLLRKFLNGSAAVDHLPLDVKATAFQRKVWQALQQIPRGQTRSYQEVARVIGQPAAARAVARACAGNPVAVAIPCHRVVRGNGQLAGYRWGLERKQRLLELERT
ncbi:MAG TPA: bifunctional DNA-binding transcriptional regulator/O6-methylguanine-DNA methyltransferase Ada [Nitrospiraceae bacterium]|nr:bifunctional DNA-binding transcriptional regulator/O6-methylguanine-DNA methyltransferase Ada [Nitrospiraceae bacterium]